MAQMRDPVWVNDQIILPIHLYVGLDLAVVCASCDRILRTSQPASMIYGPRNLCPQPWALLLGGKA